MKLVFFCSILFSMSLFFTSQLFANEQMFQMKNHKGKDSKAIQVNQGEVSGFRLVNFEKGSVYEKLGLKRGDIIKSYNGKSVDSRADAKELYETLKTADKLDLTIEREGRIQEFHYDIK